MALQPSVHPQAERLDQLFVQNLQVGKVGSSDIKVITAGATPVVDASKGNIFSLTPAEAETFSIINQSPGQIITIIVLTSGTSAFVLTGGTGVLPNGTLSTGTVSAKYFVLRYISNGTTAIEISRTTAL